MASAAAASGTQSPGALIQTNGTGTASGTPDTMSFTACVVKQDPTASAALAAANTGAAKLKTDLEAAGIADSDIKTTDFSTNPQYNYNNATPGTPPQLVGYQVSNCVSVTVHDLTKAGSILDTATKDVAPQGSVSSVQFLISDDTPLTTAARTAAYNHALAAATQYAQLSGMSACYVDSVTETSAPSVSRVYALASGAGAANVPVSPGQVQGTVSLILALRCY